MIIIYYYLIALKRYTVWIKEIQRPIDIKENLFIGAYSTHDKNYHKYI